MSWTTDLRYAARSLRFSVGFAAVAVITLALGIGATTAMFTILDGVLLKPLRYPDADRIVALDTLWKDTGKVSPRTTGGDLEDERTESTAFEAYSFYQGGELGVQLPRTAVYVGAYEVDPDFFRVFSIPPVAGRTFAKDDAGHSAVVGVGFAQRNFGSAEAALGQVVRIEGVAYEIVGVLPSMFQFPSQAQVWAAVSPVPLNRNRSGYNYYSVAKLRPGISTKAADDRLASIAARLGTSFPDTNRDKTFIVRPLQDQLAAPVRTTLLLLMGAVGLVLLIACANVANLMLARATTRSREIAVRTALGATRMAIVRQLLAESLVLAAAAGALGLLLVSVGIRALLTLGVSFVPPTLLAEIHLDWRVLGFAVLASFATSIIFGLVPAWQATRVDLQEALKQGAGRGTLGGGGSKLRNTLVVSQIALAVTLTVGAGLLFRSLLTLKGNDLGFRTQGILVTYAHMPAHSLNDALRAGQFFDELYARLRRLPGVTSAAGAVGLPAGQFNSDGSFAIEGKQTFSGDMRNLPYAGFRLASRGYFSTMAIPIIAGRDFEDSDLYDRPFVAIVSESLARQNFPNEDPIGHRLMCGLDAPDKWMTIVGVVGDVRQNSPAATPGPEIYMPLRQHPFYGNEVQVVTRSANPVALIPAVQNTIREMNPEVATKFAAMDELVSDSVAAPRFRSALAISFAGIALLLALSGMYAVMSYVTVRRTSEFGLRMALGADSANILGLVLGSAAQMGIAGVAVGVVLSIACGRLLATMLFGLQSTDVPTYLSVIAVVLPVVVIAAALPAWRASQVEPMEALRNE